MKIHKNAKNTPITKSAQLQEYIEKIIALTETMSDEELDEVLGRLDEKYGYFSMERDIPEFLDGLTEEDLIEFERDFTGVDPIMQRRVEAFAQTHIYTTFELTQKEFAETFPGGQVTYDVGSDTTSFILGNITVSLCGYKTRLTDNEIFDKYLEKLKQAVTIDPNLLHPNRTKL